MMVYDDLASIEPVRGCSCVQIDNNNDGSNRAGLSVFTSYPVYQYVQYYTGKYA